MNDDVNQFARELVGRPTEASAKRTDLEFSTSDRRFLRSLRIAVGTAIHEVEQEPR